MSIRSVFARNLRLLCSERGLSINAAAKGIGIARSQMDRYLAGANLPNDRNLARMSAFFGVEDTVLFALEEASAARSRASALAAGCRGALDLLLGSGPSAVAPGNYQTFYAQPGDPDRFMVSLTLVRRHENVTVFRRVTRFPGGSAPRRSQFYRGDHHGVVVDRLNAHYFVGLNRIGTQEPSLSVLRSMPYGEPAMRGRALVMAEAMPVALPVAMRPLHESVSLRTAIRLLGFSEVSSAGVDPLALRLLRSVEP